MTNVESQQEGNVTKDNPPPYTSGVTAPTATYLAGQQVYQPPTVHQESNVQSPPYIQNPSHGVATPQPPVAHLQEPPMDYTFPPQSITRVHVVQQPLFDSFPVNAYCPHCNTYIVTRVTEAPGSTTYCFTVVLCCIFWPLAWLPFFMSSCLDKIHRCPVCNNVLGVVSA